MILFNIFLLSTAITGLILFTDSLKKKRKGLALFSTIILLMPLIYLTIGFEFIALAPGIGLLIIYYFSSMGDEM